MNEAGLDEGRFNGADEPEGRPPPGEHQRPPSPILLELVERRARASAEDLMAGLLQEENQTRNRALRAETAALRAENATQRGEIDTLRACVGRLLGADVGVTFGDSPALLLSKAHEAGAAQRQREVDAETALAVKTSALEEERSRRREAESMIRGAENSCAHARHQVERLQGAVASMRAEATVAEDELRTERTRCQEAMDQSDYRQVLLESAHGALEAERAGRVNAEEALLIAEDGKRYYRACHTAALNGLRRERASLEAAKDLQRYYRQNQTSAIRGLKRERAAHSSHAASLTADVTTAEQALTAETARREDAEDAVKCVICLDNPRTMVLRPCRHLVLCNSCPRVTECPVCRQRVQSRVRVVLS